MSNMHRNMVVLGISFIGLMYGGYIADKYLEQKSPIVQQQVIGNGKPDIYIERSGIKYFSHVDGKEISDFVQ